MFRAPMRLSFAGGGTDLDDFIHAHGSLVVNMAITKYCYSDGRSDALPGSGLGGSSAYWVARAAQETGLRGDALIKVAAQREKASGTVGGHQDYYPATYGGLQWIRFDQDGGVRRGHLRAPRWLYNRLVLVDTGARSDNSSIVDQMGRHNEALLLFIKQMAERILMALQAGSMKGFAELMEAAFTAKLLLTPKMVTEEVARCWAVGKNAGAPGARLMGAGGGGHMLFVCLSHDQKEYIMAMLVKAGYKPQSVCVDYQGVTEYIPALRRARIGVANVHAL